MNLKRTEGNESTDYIYYNKLSLLLIGSNNTIIKHMNWFKKKLIIGCTHTVTQDILKTLDVLHKKNNNLSIDDITKLAIAQSGLAESNFSRCKGFEDRLALFIYASVQYRLVADGHAEWIVDKEFAEIVTQAYLEYINSLNLLNAHSYQTTSHGPQGFYDWYNEAINKELKGMYKDAIASFNEAIKLEPHFSKAYYNRGLAYAKIKEYTNAIFDFRKAIELDLDFMEAYYNCGIAYMKLGDNKEAFQYLKVAASLGNKKAEDILSKFKNFT